MKNKSVAVMSLGYIGLPLALAFGRIMPTIGFEISEEKVKAYREGYDPTGEMEDNLFVRADQLSYTTNPVDIKSSYHRDELTAAGLDVWRL